MPTEASTPLWRWCSTSDLDYYRPLSHSYRDIDLTELPALTLHPASEHALPKTLGEQRTCQMRPMAAGSRLTSCRDDDLLNTNNHILLQDGDTDQYYSITHIMVYTARLKLQCLCSHNSGRPCLPMNLPVSPVDTVALTAPDASHLEVYLGVPVPEPPFGVTRISSASFTDLQAWLEDYSEPVIAEVWWTGRLPPDRPFTVWFRSAWDFHPSCGLSNDQLERRIRPCVPKCWSMSFS